MCVLVVEIDYFLIHVFFFEVKIKTLSMLQPASDVINKILYNWFPG